MVIRARLALAVLVAITLADTALADVIDGAWCREAGQRLSIDGPSIVTPGGTATEGNYSRHFFTYVVPKGEPGAGTTIEMRLLNEQTMQSRPGPGGPVQTWHRCSPAVSGLSISGGAALG
jgi:hypothetical protein